MLTKDLAIAEYDFARGRIIPDRLTRQRHAHYVEYAQRMLLAYRNGVGQTRRELHRAVQAVFADEEDCPRRRIDAFCKLLDDASEYHRDRKGRAAALRREVFQLAAPRHPLVRVADRLFEREELAAKAEIAARLGRTWDEIDAELFSDVIDFHRLLEFKGYADGPALLARYNVAQVQAALFGAVKMTVWTSADLKTVLRYAKLARLMHVIDRLADGRYRFQFDGPASVLRRTRRYGAAMARFFPALAACRGWQMHAVVRVGRGSSMLALDVSTEDGLHSHLPAPDEFDSSLEESFAANWGDGPRDGWRLFRETEVLSAGQRVFVPDFVLRHDDGRTALLEIVGYWTPGYLRAKLDTLRRMADRRILLAVARPDRKAAFDFREAGVPVIEFRTALKADEVLEAVRTSQF